MKKIKNLSSISSYADLLKFAHSSAALSITDEDAIRFYENSPEDWKQALLNMVPPSPEVEKTIIRYGDEETVNLLRIRHGFYPETIEWAMEQESPDIAEVVVKNLKKRPSAKAEVQMVRRGEAELLKLYIAKFHFLEDDAERVINEDPRLYSLLQLYLDMRLS